MWELEAARASAEGMDEGRRSDWQEVLCPCPCPVHFSYQTHEGDPSPFELERFLCRLEQRRLSLRVGNNRLWNLASSRV
jgi:hypothetical protein